MSPLVRLALNAITVLSGMTAAGALFVWWRGGMWSNGELPTHGMAASVGLALAAALFAQSCRAAHAPGAPRRRAVAWGVLGVAVLAGFAAAFAVLRP